LCGRPKKEKKSVPCVKGWIFPHDGQKGAPAVAAEQFQQVVEAVTIVDGAFMI
jgi:hypothetical protein